MPGYNFNKAKTKRLKAALEKAKRSPEFARRLLGIKKKPK